MAKPKPQQSSAKPAAAGRKHRATYARDKKKGGYIIRVQGPHSNAFAGREVPVTRMDNTESPEKLERLIWTGKDEKTGDPVSLYSFAAKPREALPDDVAF